MGNSAFREIISKIKLFSNTAKSFNALQNFTISVIAERLPHYN